MYIIAPSHYARDEIERRLGFDGDRVFSIHHGVDHNRFSPNSEPDAQMHHFLHISYYQPSKNLENIMAAFNRLSGLNGAYLLAVVPGYQGQDRGEGIRLIRTPLKQEEILQLYRNAGGFVFPSLRETFGMPILEAMACGCPVITSNTSACAEVAGDAAMLVDPRSVDDIASAMQRLVTDQGLRRSLRKRGILHSRRFSWLESAKSHYSVFRKALGDTS
jgi:glycosyltransferase involved in cell wall biosynthesis